MTSVSKGLIRVFMPSLVAAALLIGPAAGLASASAEAAEDAAFPGLDAVFVLDTSYSMNASDPQHVATEVINMFMDMGEASSTRVGLAAYNDTLVSRVPLTPVDQKEKRDDFKRQLSELRRSGYTDVGLGLRTGTDLLKADKPKGNKPFVILLSDGETDFGGRSKGRTLKDSEADIAVSIDSARKGQYPIYTIGLNHDGTVNENELKRIASETGGQSYITDSADDLPEIFNKIFAEQFESRLVSVAAVTATGSLQEVAVTIPNGSMTEANLVLLADHPIGEAQLYYQSANIRYTKSSSYSLLKILQPDKGTFKLKFRGQAGDLVKVSLLGNYDMHLQAHSADGAPVKGKPYSFEASLVHPDGGLLQDRDTLEPLKADLVVRDSSGQETAVPMKLEQDNRFRADYTFKTSGVYSWSVRLNGADFYRSAQGSERKVANAAPEALNGDSLSFKKEDGLQTIRLSGYFADANGDPLSYRIASEASDSYEARIEGEELLLKAKRSGKMEIAVEATDPEGGTATNAIRIEVRSLWERYLRIGAIAAAVLAIGALLYWRFRPKPSFSGRLEGYFLETASGNDIPVKYWPLTSFEERKLTLKRLFASLDVHEPLPETERIVFEAKADGMIAITHHTRCTVSIGTVPVPSGSKAVLRYNEKLYITFEDGITEIEIRYKAIKPSTNILGGRAS